MNKVIVEIEPKKEVEVEAKVEVWIAGKKVFEYKKEKVEVQRNTEHK